MRLLVGGVFVLPDVDAERADALTAPRLEAQAIAESGGAGVGEAVGIHDGLEGGVAKDARAFITGLSLRGDGTDFHVAEAEGGRAAPAKAVFVEASGEADMVREFQAEGLDGSAAFRGEPALQ